MTKKAQKKTLKRGRRRGRQKESVLLQGTQPPSDPSEGSGTDTPPARERDTSTLLTHAIRAAGILPIVALVGILLTHHLYAGLIPSWFKPILNQQVAVLTLCAGHAAIIGLWITTRDRYNWSTLALAIAAVATAGAGYRSVAESMAGHVIVILLFLLLIPSIWVESLSARLMWVWRFKKGFLTGTLVVLWVILVTVNQLQNENYIRNWILIPLGIILGFPLAIAILWTLLRLGFRYLPLACSWIKERLAPSRNMWRLVRRTMSSRR